jgi:hypothetical protein
MDKISSEFDVLLFNEGMNDVKAERNEPGVDRDSVHWS